MTRGLATWLLARLGYMVVDVDGVARRCAAALVDGYGSDLHLIDSVTGKRALMRRYLQVALETGLPPLAGTEVVERAWRHLEQASTVVESSDGFSFYD